MALLMRASTSMQEAICSSFPLSRCLISDSLILDSMSITGVDFMVFEVTCRINSSSPFMSSLFATTRLIMTVTSSLPTFFLLINRSSICDISNNKYNTLSKKNGPWHPFYKFSCYSLSFLTFPNQIYVKDQLLICFL